jgi:hypothetical protein
LPTQRFKDLAYDVFYELERRSPYLVHIYTSKFGNDNTFAANEDIKPKQPVDIPARSAPKPTPEPRLPPPRNNLDNLMNDLGSFNVLF